MISVRALVIVTMVLGGVGSVWAQAVTPDSLRRAELGTASAQYDLGVAYAQGLDVPQDYARAAAWYRKAAEQGDARAQTNLGGMYGNGQGVARDDAQAAVWYRKAAEQGFAPAKTELDAMKSSGKAATR